MAEESTLETFVKPFRVYKGESECPYTEETLEQRHKWFMWTLERCLAEAPKEDVLRRYVEMRDSVPLEIENANVTPNEKIAAFYIFVASDTMMAKRSLGEYFSMPIVYEMN